MFSVATNEETELKDSATDEECIGRITLSILFSSFQHELT